MVINHLEKLFVTSDASTIINELEVEHPAAKLLVFAAQAQQQEIGDGTNFVRRPSNALTGLAGPAALPGTGFCTFSFSPDARSFPRRSWRQVVSFAGDLLSAAEGLLRDGLHTSEVADGYAKAGAKVCAPFVAELHAALWRMRLC